MKVLSFNFFFVLFHIKYADFYFHFFLPHEKQTLIKQGDWEKRNCDKQGKCNFFPNDVIAIKTIYIRHIDLKPEKRKPFFARSKQKYFSEHSCTNTHVLRCKYFLFLQVKWFLLYRSYPFTDFYLYISSYLLFVLHCNFCYLHCVIQIKDAKEEGWWMMTVTMYFFSFGGDTFHPQAINVFSSKLFQ